MAKQPDPVVSGFFANAVTDNDAAAVTVPGIFNFIVPVYGGAYIISQLPPECPPYTPNNKHRDTILSITPLIEGLWADAVDISISKIVSRGYEFQGPDAQTKFCYDMFKTCDTGNGFEKFLSRHLRDYKTTDNGAWVGLARDVPTKIDEQGREIPTRASRLTDKVLSFYHMDSLRTWRTGDPNCPAYYYDLKGHYHKMMWWDCFNIVDMPSPRAGFYNSGICAAAKAYREIRKMSAMSIYVDEKLTGSGATEIEFIQGVTAKQIQDAMIQADADQAQKGVIYYKGKVLIPVLSDLQLSTAKVNLKGIPDGFDRKEEYLISALVYAKSLGLVPTELDPQLTARGALGVGQAEQIQAENAQGYGDGAWEKQWTENVNERVVPSRTTHAISSRNLRDEKMQADVTAARATGWKTFADAGFITAQQGTQLAVDAGDLPRVFLTAPDQTVDNTVTDDQQVEQQLTDENKTPAQPAPAAPPAPPVPTPTKKELDEIDNLLALKESLDATRAEIAEARKDIQPWYRRIGAK